MAKNKKKVPEEYSYKFKFFSRHFFRRFCLRHVHKNFLENFFKFYLKVTQKIFRLFSQQIFNISDYKFFCCYFRLNASQILMHRSQPPFESPLQSFPCMHNSSLIFLPLSKSILIVDIFFEDFFLFLALKQIVH